MAKIVLAANTGWYLYNFRRGLIAKLVREGNDLTIVCPSDKYVDGLVALGCKHVALHHMSRRGMFPPSEGRSVFELYQVYRKLKPDLVHQFTFKVIVYGTLAASLVKIPAIINSLEGQGYLFSTNESFLRKLRPWLVRCFRKIFANPRAHWIFLNPEDLASFSRYQLVKQGQATLIKSCGVDTSYFSAKSSCLIRPTRRILFASRLLWQKGIAEFVEAARLIRGQREDVEFIVAGDIDLGNPNSVDRATLEEWIASGVIRYMGHCHDMRQLLEDVDIVALPTYYGEGVPKILLEAAAMQRALVTTEWPGCREVVSDGRTGLTVRPKDADHLVQTLLKLVENPDLGRKLGSQSRALVQQAFEEDKINQQTLNVYGRLGVFSARFSAEETPVHEHSLSRHEQHLEVS